MTHALKRILDVFAISFSRNLEYLKICFLNLIDDDFVSFRNIT